MAETSGPISDPVFESLTTMEHEDLGQVVEMLVKLEGLRANGLSADEIGRKMAATQLPPPTVETWDAATVTKVLGIVDSIRAERDPVPPTATEPAAPPMQRAMDGVDEQIDGLDVLDAETANRATSPSPHSQRTGADEQAMATWSIRVAGEPLTAPVKPIGEEGSSRDRKRRRPAWVLLAVLALFGLGSGAYLGYVALTSTTTSTSGTTNTDTAAVLPTTTAPTSSVAPSTTEAPDPADTMAIRIEPDAPAAASAGDLTPATATIRNDGLLHLEGVFPSQDEADRFIASAAGVFGRENIVESYSIDESAPVADVSDVALDKPVLFETGTATIDPTFIPFLEACGNVLKLNPHITMSIAAFTDSKGDETFNLELSQRRAETIVQFYRDLEIEESQLIGVGYGEADPIADNDTEVGREQNRRAMLQLLNVVEDQQPASGG